MKEYSYDDRWCTPQQDTKERVHQHPLPRGRETRPQEDVLAATHDTVRKGNNVQPEDERLYLYQPEKTHCHGKPTERAGEQPYAGNGNSFADKHSLKCAYNQAAKTHGEPGVDGIGYPLWQLGEHSPGG